MSATVSHNVMVCEDCYFAHHYGSRREERINADGWYVVWYAGESDTPSDREPLALLGDVELSDNTDADTGDGIDGFSWSWCDGCGSALGGARYRLAVWS